LATVVRRGQWFGDREILRNGHLQEENPYPVLPARILDYSLGDPTAVFRTPVVDHDHVPRQVVAPAEQPFQLLHLAGQKVLAPGDLVRRQDTLMLLVDGEHDREVGRAIQILNHAPGNGHFHR
jgi:hypothetical protein